MRNIIDKMLVDDNGTEYYETEKDELEEPDNEVVLFCTFKVENLVIQGKFFTLNSLQWERCGKEDEITYYIYK